jgi:phosphate transport system permease protein
MGVIATWPLGWLAAVLVLAAGLVAWRAGHARALALAGAPGIASGIGAVRLHSLPGYHGWYVALWTALPGLVILLASTLLLPRLNYNLLYQLQPASLKDQPLDQIVRFLESAQAVAYGGQPVQTGPDVEAAAQTLLSIDGATSLAALVLALVAGAIGFWWARRAQSRDLRARNRVETIGLAAMFIASAIAVLTTLGIVLSLVFETAKFFSGYSPLEFLFGTQWSPQIAIRADQIGQSGAFGAVPLFLGTVLIMLIAMVVAVPVGLGSAVYLSEYASERTRSWVKPVLELLAGIPTVVYGFFALLFVAPLVRDAGQALGLDVASQSALAAGLVMGIMIIPFISSLSDDVINAVPQALRDGSFAMGATKSETVLHVVLPAALPGIVGSVLLAVSKALGETMIVTMAAGQNANLSANPLDMVTTVTVQIVTLLTGDQEYDSPKTHAAFALGFVLFFVTLVLNIIALRVVQKYREKYD